MIFEVQYLDTRKKEKFECAQTKCIVGRSKNVDVTIVREELSRSHFEVEYVDKKFYLTDLNSTNGLIVNGERLPAGERVLYQNIFPIEIGDKISILISADSEAPVEESPSSLERFNVKRPAPVVSRDETRTTVSPRRPMGATSRRQSHGTAMKSNPQMLVTLFIVLAMGAGVYYYYSQKEDPASAEVITGNGDSNLGPPKVQGPAPFKSSELDLSKLLSQNQCDKFGTLCADMKLSRPLENVVLADQKLIVFVNVAEYKIENEHSAFSKLSEVEKFEYILAYTGLNPILINVASEQKATHLIVVGFSSIEGLTVVKGILNINYAIFSGITEAFHRNFFSNIFYGGIFRDYKMDIRPQLKFQVQ